MKGLLSTSIDVALFERPDVILKQNLDRNPIFPFVVIGDNVYALTVQSSKLYMYTFLALVTAVVTTSIYGYQENANELLIYPIIIFLGFFRQIVKFWKDRTYVLDSNKKMYEFYRGNKLIYRGHYHNIYIRLIGQNTGNGDVYYNVVLEGYYVDSTTITSAVTFPKKLMKLAKKLAYRLDLNYFDPADRSRGHIIRHRCPYATDILLKKIKSRKTSTATMRRMTTPLTTPVPPAELAVPNV